MRAGPGAFVLVPPGVPHTFANRGDIPARFVNVHARPASTFASKRADSGPRAFRTPARFISVGSGTAVADRKTNLEGV